MKALHHQGQPDDDGRLAAGGEQQPREEEKDDVFDGIGERVGVVGGVWPRCGSGAWSSGGGEEVGAAGRKLGWSRTLWV